MTPHTRIAIIAIAAVALALSALFTWALAKQGWSAAETNWRDGIEVDTA